MVITRDDPDIPMEREERFDKWELLMDMDKDLIVDRLTVNYRGIFKWDELFVVLESWCKKKAYVKERLVTKHKMTPKGKNHSVSFRLFKKITSLDFSVMFMDIKANNVTDVQKTIDGSRYNLNEGEVTIVFVCYHMAHKKMRWETKPKFAVIRAFIDKFLVKLERPEVPGTIVGDTKDLAMKLRAAMFLWYHKLEAEKAAYHMPTGMYEEIPDLSTSNTARGAKVTGYKPGPHGQM